MSALSSATGQLAAAAASTGVHIDFAALFKVAGVSLAFGVGVVTVFSIGLLGLSMAEGRTETKESSAAKTVGTGLAAVCFLACAAAVGFGIWLIVPQFH